MAKSLLLGLLLAAAPAFAYRPFVSTDAAVADLHEVEIEMGAFTLTRTGATGAYSVPQAVYNYGVVHRVEAVAQTSFNEAQHGPTRIGENELSVKVVAKEGFLQEKPGDSVAFETALLLPSDSEGEERTGFSETGIWSHNVYGTIFHVNAGAGIDQLRTDAFAQWGVIAERLLSRHFRIVGEINGQSQPELPPNNSGLVGTLWETPKPNLFIDAGVRRGLSAEAADWQYTVGFTYGFIFPKVLKTVPQQPIGEPRGPA